MRRTFTACRYCWYWGEDIRYTLEGKRFSICNNKEQEEKHRNRVSEAGSNTMFPKFTAAESGCVNFMNEDALCMIRYFVK